MNKKSTIKLIIYWGLFLVICICIIFFVIKTSKKKISSPDAANVSQEDLTGNESTEEEKNILIKCDIPEINALIQSLLDAELSCDFNKAGTFDLNKEAYANKNVQNNLKFIAELVDKYTVTDCYLKKGLLPDTYLVFAEVNTKIKNIDTLGPGLNQYYVVKTPEGLYMVDSSDQEPSIANYIEDLRSEEDCLDLVDTINQKIQAANKSDKKLAEFYQKYQ